MRRKKARTPIPASSAQALAEVAARVGTVEPDGRVVARVRYPKIHGIATSRVDAGPAGRAALVALGADAIDLGRGWEPI